MLTREMLAEARRTIGPYCKVCKQCDGEACKGLMPGPGGKGIGLGFTRNYQAFRRVALEMNTLHSVEQPDTTWDFFGTRMQMPVFAAPIGAVQLHYGPTYNDASYSQALVAGCKVAGVLPWTGDGVVPEVFIENLMAISTHRGWGIPTIKPWSTTDVIEKLRLAEQEQVPAVAMDVDAAGLTFLAAQGKAVFPVSGDRLKEIVAATSLPFIVKGIMTVSGARAAKAAGARAIVVSNHGGRVLDETPSTLSVLTEIRQAVGSDFKILLDGGVRTGLDVFKALALGADAVLIGRPLVTAIYGGGADGVVAYLRGIAQELESAMLMTGCKDLGAIDSTCVRWIRD